MVKFGGAQTPSSVNNCICAKYAPPRFLYLGERKRRKEPNNWGALFQWGSALTKSERYAMRVLWVVSQEKTSKYPACSKTKGHMWIGTTSEGGVQSENRRTSANSPHRERKYHQYLPGQCRRTVDRKLGKGTLPSENRRKYREPAKRPKEPA